MTEDQLKEKLSTFTNELKLAGADKQKFLESMGELVLERVSKKYFAGKTSSETALLINNTELLDKVIVEELQKSYLEFCK